ncbi:MAG: 2-oxoacid:acceptor oxidoreductase family protein [Desulfobacteraceae bacterium]
MHEIKFHGRGGQGVVMASQMLGLAFFRAGMHPQCYSLFGGERRGAPVVSFLRVDKEKVLLKCEIKHPNELLCFDESLLNPGELRALMRQGSRILVSTDKTIKAFQELSGFDLGLVDATAIAAKLGLGHVINSTVLGAYCRLTGRPPLDDVIDAVEEMVPANKEKNVEAVRQGYANLSLQKPRQRAPSGRAGVNGAGSFTQQW